MKDSESRFLVFCSIIMAAFALALPYLVIFFLPLTFYFLSLLKTERILLYEPAPAGDPFTPSYYNRGPPRRFLL